LNYSCNFRKAENSWDHEGRSICSGFGYLLFKVIILINGIFMKNLFILFLFAGTTLNGQLTINEARKIFYSYKLGSYDYHEQFVGHRSYGAPYILTSDGGAAFFGGSGDDKGTFGLAVKIDSTGKEEWQKKIYKQFDEMETQSIVQDRAGNFCVFLLSYDNKRYRGGSERVLYLDKTGKTLWDKTLGDYTLMNNPTISYIRALDDGRIELRGHICTDKPEPYKDPAYRYWEAWLDNQGRVTQKTGGVIDWGNPDWQKLYSPGSETKSK
jgi:hypothetical protein